MSAEIPVAEPPATPAPPPPIPRPALNARQELYCQLVVGSGLAMRKAYRKAYARPKATNRQAKDRVDEIMANPSVRARIAELRARSAGRTLLTLNDRLHLLSEAANAPVKNAMDRNARARVIQVYNETAGDKAPDREEVTLRSDPNSPVRVEHVHATKAEKIAALRALRAGRAPAVPPGQAPLKTEGAA